MAKLTYDETGRLIFTKEMKEEYTILLPNMLPIHFSLIERCLRLDGYKTELLTTNNPNIVNEGLKNVHNDTCYPALLVIGQLLDALKSGKYDLNKTALMITQTGGGCRASNYIHLLRKALKRSGLDYVPVVSLNLSGLEKNPGFSLNYKLVKRMVYSLIYGDLLMALSNQTRPYELQKGETDARLSAWKERLTEEFTDMKKVRYRRIKEVCREIVLDFASIERSGENKIKVGVVGEIYIKYAALGNNNLEELLFNEGAEVVVPGLIDFIIFKIDNRIEDLRLYGGKQVKNLAYKPFINFIKNCQKDLISLIREYSDFRPMQAFDGTKELVQEYTGYGNKMGEGWLLTGEMLELIHSGVHNIVCTQPFGCLPNHIVGKGMIRKIKDNHPESNIVAIDYDPGATRINQENRIKLMLANAKLNLKPRETAAAAAQEAPVPSSEELQPAHNTI